ncbi:MAG: hypothetical protein WC389_15335 [Lutibacter sp.]|jgi:hypothetical protein
MYTLIIASVIIVAIIILGLKYRDTDFLPFGIFLCISFNFCFFLFSGFFSSATDEDIIKVNYEINIISMKDTTLGNGYYYLFGGSYKENPCYFFYKKLNDGTYQLDKISADKTYIHEENRTDGLIKVDESRYIVKRGFTNWTFILFEYDYTNVNRYDVFIPNDSIKREFNLDASK